MTLVGYRAVLTEESYQFSMEGAWDSTRDWIGVRTPSSHGSLPTQSAETHAGATALGLVSVSQGQRLLSAASLE